MPSIRDFSGGVVNQELLGKDGGAGIMIDANNVLSSWNGELRKRTGSRIIAQLEKKSRIIPYRLPNNDDALLLFTDGNVKGYEITDSGLSPLSKGAANKLEYPSENFESSSNFYMTLGDGSKVDAWSGMGASFYDRDLTTPKYVTFHNKTESFVFEGIKFTFSSSWVDGNVYFYFTNPVLLFSDDGILWTAVKTSFSESKHRDKGAGFWYSDNTYVEVSITNEDIVEPHKYWRVRFDKGVNTVGDDGLLGIAVSDINMQKSTTEPLDEPTAYSADDLEKIKFAQLGQEIYFACENRLPYAVKYDNKTNSLSAGKFLEGNAVLEDNGLPSCVSGFQNRLCFGGFNFHKQRVILSEFGKFDNFTIKTTDVKSTDPISADSVELRASIENLWAGNNALYALSSDGVSMIDAQGGVIATDQISFKLRNREPADGMTPTTKDDIMIYLGNDRRKIFITDYDFIVQRFKAKDLSVGYNGFLTSRIVALHYASRKCSLIYGYKDDGNMLALLFDVDMQKNALFPCDIGGDIKDMQVFKSGDKFRVLMVAQIDDRWYLIEKNEQPDYTVMDFMSEENKREYSKTVVQDGLYLDYMTRRYYNAPVDFLEELPYGIGEKVAVFADGKYIGEKICSAGGPYAWTGNNETIYTKSDTPQVGDSLYNKDNVELTDKKLLTVSGDKISVQVRGEDIVSSVPYYGWAKYPSITGSTLGVLARNVNGDGVQSNRVGADMYKFGWGNYFTYKPVPANNAQICSGVWAVQDTIASFEKVVFYTKKQSPTPGDEVYDSNFNLVGTIAEIGTTNTLNVSSPTSLKHIVVNGEKVYISSEDDATKEERVPTYNAVEYARTPYYDLQTGPTGLRLDYPASDFVLGYNYDAYAVLKLATPYTSKKYPKEVATYLINTGYLEIGNSFDNLQPILNNMRDKLDLFDKPMLLNGEYTKTMDKLDNSPYIILRSNEPMPFMITGIDFKVDYSNYQGGI